MPLFDYDRASHLMGAHGVDVLIACTRTNVSYLADYYAHYIAKQPFYLEDGAPYEILAGIPREQEKGAFLSPCTAEEGELSTGECWIKDIKYYGPSLHISGTEGRADIYADAAQATAQALRERVLEAGCLGVEMNYIPVTLFRRLQELLPRATFVDAEPLLWELRAIKSPEEIRRIREAARATTAAMWQAFRSVRVGQSEKELEKIIHVRLAEEGAGWEWNHVAFGPKGAQNVRPTENRIKPGEIVRLDIGGIYLDYVCDMSRVAVLGRPTGELRRVHDAVLTANRAVRSAIEPGIRCSELYWVGQRVMQQAGYDLFIPIVGHGVGRDVHEPPFLSAENDSIIQVGMVLTVEIALRVSGLGSVNVEDEVLVTESGSELITTASPELMVLI
jgi:Xaa-Pro aminopeptidase